MNPWIEFNAAAIRRARAQQRARLVALALAIASAGMVAHVAQKALVQAAQDAATQEDSR